MIAVHLSTIGTYLPIPGYDGYWVTDDGRVFSCYSKGRLLGFANGRRVIPGGFVHELTGSTSTRGYRQVRLRRNEKGRHIYIHRLVLEAFVGPCPDKMETRHLDGDKKNNHVSNLKWGTQEENNDDKMKHGKIPSGDCHKQAKLSSDDVHEIVIMSRSGVMRKDVARRFGITPSNVHAIMSGRSWKHVTQKLSP